MKRVGRALLGALAILLTGTASAHAAPFVYMTNEVGDAVSQFDATGGGLASLMPSGVATGDRPTDVAVTPDGAHAFVTNGNDFSITSYLIGHDGHLTQVGTVRSDRGPNGLATSADGRYVYASNAKSNRVSEFAIRPDGGLRPLGEAPADPASKAVTVGPDGRYAYAAALDGGITEYEVGDDGRLRQIGHASTGSEARTLTVTPDGRHAYVTGRDQNGIWEFAVGTDGHLTALGSLTTAAGPSGLAVTPDSEHAYVSRRVRGVDEYDIGPGGRLHELGTAPGEGQESDVVVAPDGRHAYVANSFGESASVYGIGPAGRLHPEGFGQGGERPSALAVTGQTPGAAHGRVARNADGRLEVFVLRDGRLWSYRQREPGGAFPAAPELIGGHGLVGRPVAGVLRDGRLAVLAIDGEHGHVHLAVQHRAGSDFGPVRSLGAPDPDGMRPSHPSVAANANGLLEVFATRHGGGLSALRQHRDGTFPDSWTDLGGRTQGGPGAATDREGLIQVASRSGNGDLLLWYQREPNGHLIGPERQLPGGQFSADPDLVREADGRVVVFARHAGDGHIWTDAQRPASERFAHDWTDLGGPGGHGEPDATTNADGRLEVIARNRDEGVSAARQTKPGAHFHAWTDLGGHNLGFLPAALGDVAGRIALFVTSEHHSKVYLNHQTAPNGDFERHFSYVGPGD